MYRFGFQGNYSQPKIDFDVLFGREDLTAEVLLSTPDIIDQVRINTDGFSDRLRVRPDIVRQLIDYAVRPELQEQRKGTFPITYPYIAIELLCGHNQHFLDFVLGNRKADKQEPPLSSEANPQETVAEEKEKTTLVDTECPLSYMLKALEAQTRLNETAAGYLLRFLGQLQYQRGTELFQYFDAAPTVVNNMLKHAYSKSLTDAISKLLCVEQEEFAATKERFLGRFFESFANESREKELGERLENFVFMLEDLIERCQDRYDGARFTTLLSRSISLSNVELLKDIIMKRFESELVLLPGLDVLTMLFAFYKADRLKNERKNNANNNDSDIKEPTVTVQHEEEPSIVNNDVLLAVEKLVSELLQKFQGKELNFDWNVPQQNGVQQNLMVEEPNGTGTPTKVDPPVEVKGPEQPSPSKSESMLLQETPVKAKFKFSQLKLFLLVQDLITLEPKNSNFEEELLTVPFVRYAVKLIKEHPHNNLMHNTFKHIIVKGIKGKGKTARVICSKQAALLQFIMEATKVNPTYTNQLHHISRAIEDVRKSDEALNQTILQDTPAWDEYINNSYSDTVKAHNRLLGGEDPRKRSQITMLGFCNRIGRTAGATKEEVVEAVKYPLTAEKGEMGDDNEEQVGNINLGIDSDDESSERPKESGSKLKRGLALCALLTKDEVKSEDEDTVRMEEQMGSTPMEIEITTEQKPNEPETLGAGKEEVVVDIPAEPLAPESQLMTPEEIPHPSTEQPPTTTAPTSEL